VLAEGVALPEPPRYLKAVLVPEDGGHAAIEYDHPAFGEQREIRVPAPGPGRMRVQWLLEESGGVRMLHVEPAQIVEVLEVETEQIFVVHLPEDALRNARGGF